MNQNRQLTNGDSDNLLTHSQITEAALRIADSGAGLDGLTVRRIARELGVGTMTLYSYFRSKDEILDSMADHVLGGMQLPAADQEAPSDAIRVVAHAFFDLMRSHPSVARLFSTRVTTSLTAMRGAMEVVIARLVSAGIPGPMAVRCYGFLITYAIGFASYQNPRPWGLWDPAEQGELRRQRGHFYAALPRVEFPMMVELADTLVTLPSDEQFNFGVEAFISWVTVNLNK